MPKIRTDGPGEPATSVGPDVRARRALHEARREATATAARALDIALLAGLAAVGQGEGPGRPRPVLVGMASDRRAGDRPRGAAPGRALAELSPGRLRDGSLVLFGLPVAADAVAVGVLLSALVGSSAESLSAGDLLVHGTVVWASNIVAFGLRFWQLDGGGPRLRGGSAGARITRRVRRHNGACTYMGTCVGRRPVR